MIPVILSKNAITLWAIYTVNFLFHPDHIEVCCAVLLTDIDCMTNRDKTTPSADSLNVLLADDDSDDRYFFKKVIDEMSIAVKLATVANGEELLLYLNAKPKNPTDILFLDLDMPKKNGSECLVEIKNSQKFKRLPVVIYSASLSKSGADFLYDQGAYFYIHKTDTAELRKVLHHILLNLSEHKLGRPKREEFVIQKFA